MTLNTLSVYEQFTAQARRTPGAVAITAPGRLPLTYTGLLSHVESVRQSLNACGVGGSDRVVVVLGNGPEMAVAFMAIASFATAVPLNAAYRAEELTFYLSRLNARAIIVRADDATGVKE